MGMKEIEQRDRWSEKKGDWEPIVHTKRWRSSSSLPASLSLSLFLSLSLSLSFAAKQGRPAGSESIPDLADFAVTPCILLFPLSFSLSLFRYVHVGSSLVSLYFFLYHERIYIYIYTDTSLSCLIRVMAKDRMLEYQTSSNLFFFLNILSFLRSFPSRNYFQFFSPEIGREVFLYVSCEWQTREKSCWCNVISEIDENRFSRYPCCCFLYFHSREINVTLLYLGKFIWSLKNLVTDILGRNCYSTWKKRKTQIFIETLVLFTV